MPRRIDMWVEENENVTYVANVYYCDDKEERVEHLFGHPDITKPIIPTNVIEDEQGDELTACEKADKKRLKDLRKFNQDLEREKHPIGFHENSK